MTAGDLTSMDVAGGPTACSPRWTQRTCRLARHQLTTSNLTAHRIGGAAAGVRRGTAVRHRWALRPAGGCPPDAAGSRLYRGRQPKQKDAAGVACAAGKLGSRPTPSPGPRTHRPDLVSADRACPHHGSRRRPADRQGRRRDRSPPRRRDRRCGARRGGPPVERPTEVEFGQSSTAPCAAWALTTELRDHRGVWSQRCAPHHRPGSRTINEGDPSSSTWPWSTATTDMTRTWPSGS